MMANTNEVWGPGGSTDRLYKQLDEALKAKGDLQRALYALWQSYLKLAGVAFEGGDLNGSTAYIRAAERLEACFDERTRESFASMRLAVTRTLVRR